MNRNTIIAIVGIALITGVTMASPVIAQSTESATPTENESSVMKIDNHVTLIDYRFTETEIIVTLEASRKSHFKMTDMFVSGSGAQELTTKSGTLAKGKNTVRMEITTWNGYHGASIATVDGAIAISERSSQGSKLLKGNYGGNTLLMFGAFGSFIGVTTVAFAAFRISSERSSTIEKEL